MYDVIVVGSGAGALVGAYTAAAHGLRTLVLEKAAVVGGTSAYSGGAMFLPGNHVTVGAGLPDSYERGATYLGALLGEHDRERREAFLRTGPELLAYLATNPLIAFEHTEMPEYFAAPGRLARGGQVTPLLLSTSEVDPDVLALVRQGISADRSGTQAPRDPLWGGQSLITRLLTALLRTGNATVRTQACVEALIEQDGRVVGVEATTPDGRLSFHAGRGVLLGSGGFERSQSLRERFGVPGLARHSAAPAESNTGEPLLAALALGAAADHLDQAWHCPSLLEPDGSAGFLVGPHGGFIVDAQGERFANESLPYDQFGRAMAKHAPTAWFVFDSREGGRLPAVRCVPGARREHYLDSGAWVQAETIAELAALIGAPSLAGTADRFAAAVAHGVDEDFHRGEDEFDRYFARGTGPNPCLLPVDQPPYFAARIVLGDLGTKGGLLTDADANVVREDGSAIAGLYATGNVMASVSGPVYPAPGTPIGLAAVFGYRAALALVGQAPRT